MTGGGGARTQWFGIGLIFLYPTLMEGATLELRLRPLVLGELFP
jgi:hypothetical protein